MTSPNTERWKKAERLALEPLPPSMSKAHLKRARLYVVCHGTFALLSFTISLYIAQNSVDESPLGKTILIGCTALALFVSVLWGAVTGRLADWSSPLLVLTRSERQKVIENIFSADKPPSQPSPLIQHLSSRFMFGSGCRIILASLIVILLLEMSFLIPTLVVFKMSFLTIAATVTFVVLKEFRRRIIIGQES